MRVYVEAYRADGSQVLGNLDGQTCLKVRDYRRTDHYKALKAGRYPVSKKIHHWKVVTESGSLLETISNPKHEEMK